MTKKTHSKDAFLDKTDKIKLQKIKKARRVKKNIIKFGLYSFLGILLGTSYNCYAKKLSFCTTNWPPWEYALVVKSASKFDMKYSTYRTCGKNFFEDNLDITFLGLYDFVRLERKKSAPSSIILITDYSKGGDKIAIKESFTLDKSKKPNVALQIDSLSTYLLYLFSKSNGLDLGEDMKLLNVRTENLKSMFLNKDIDMMVGWDPNLDGIEQHNYKILSTSADFPHEIYDVLVVKNSVLSDKKSLADIKEFTKEYLNALKSEKAISEIVNQYNNGITEEEFKISLESVYMFKEKDEIIKTLKKLGKKAKEHDDFILKYSKILNEFGPSKPKGIDFWESRISTVALD